MSLFGRNQFLRCLQWYTMRDERTRWAMVFRILQLLQLTTKRIGRDDTPFFILARSGLDTDSVN